MEITLEVLDKHLEELNVQKQNAAAQVHAVSGAIQILELLRKQLTNSNGSNPIIPTV